MSADLLSKSPASAASHPLTHPAAATAAHTLYTRAYLASQAACQMEQRCRSMCAASADHDGLPYLAGAAAAQGCHWVES